MQVRGAADLRDYAALGQLGSNGNRVGGLAASWSATITSWMTWWAAYVVIGRPEDLCYIRDCGDRQQHPAEGRHLGRLVVRRGAPEVLLAHDAPPIARRSGLPSAMRFVSLRTHSR